MKIIKEKIEISELKEMSKTMEEPMVKAMVDVEKGIMAVDAPMHSDLLEYLVGQEQSEPQYLWGINIRFDKGGEYDIEFDSAMNYKVALGNRTRGVEDENIRRKIIEIVKKLIK